MATRQMTPEERHKARVQRWHAEEAKISKEAQKLAAAQNKRENLENELKLERSALAVSLDEWREKQDVAGALKSDVRQHAANVRHLEFALGLRKRRGGLVAGGSATADAETQQAQTSRKEEAPDD